MNYVQNLNIKISRACKSFGVKVLVKFDRQDLFETSSLEHHSWRSSGFSSCSYPYGTI